MNLLPSTSRQFLEYLWPVLTMAGLAAFLSSCDRATPDRNAGGPRGDEDPIDRGHSQHPAFAPVPKLAVLTWEEYLSPEVLERFEEQTGVEIDYQTIENSSEFAQLLASEPGRFDVVIADDRTLIELDKLDLIQPLNASSLKNLGNLNPDFLGRDFDPDNSFSIPYLWGTTLIAYRKDHLPDPPRSWNHLLDGRLHGKLALLDEPNDLLMIGLLALGSQPESATPAAFDQATDLLVGHLDGHGGAMWELYDALDALDRGEISAAISYSGDALLYAEENEEIGYFIPEEGAPLWIDSLAICRTSRNPDEAHRFIDFMIDAEMAATTANTLRLASPNRAAAPMIDEALLTDPAIYPPEEVMERCRFIRLDPDHHVTRSTKRIYEQELRNGATAASFGDPAAEAEPLENR